MTTTNPALKSLHIHLDYDGVTVDKLKNIQHGGCIDSWSNHLDKRLQLFISQHSYCCIPTKEMTRDKSCISLIILVISHGVQGLNTVTVINVIIDYQAKCS